RFSPADGAVLRLDADERDAPFHAAVVRLRVDERERIDARDRHARVPAAPTKPASAERWSLPVAVIGRSSTKKMSFGRLKPARFARQYSRTASRVPSPTIAAQTRWPQSSSSTPKIPTDATPSSRSI